MTAIESIPDLKLPTDYPQPSPPKCVQNEFIISLESFRSSIDGIRDGLAVSKLKVHAFSILQAGLVVLLHRYTGNEFVCFGTAGGHLVCRVEEEMTFMKLLEHLQMVFST